jgi:hypothetical protein
MLHLLPHRLIEPSILLFPPKPRQGRPRLIRLLATLKRNPLECWSEEFFEQPIARVRLPFLEALLLHDPAAIKHVLVDNAANYRKDPIQRRILAAGLSDGLLSVEGDRWERNGARWPRYSLAAPLPVLPMPCLRPSLAWPIGGAISHQAAPSTSPASSRC